MADQGAEGRLSPFLRRQRFKAALPYIRGSVLDIGCGTGDLAQYFDSENYYGYDIDKDSIEIARKKFPNHCFNSTLPSKNKRFLTVVSLAVIEHVPSSFDFLFELRDYLCDDPYARIVCTTPHPSFEWFHDLGAFFGLFSKHANEEHEELLDRKKLYEAGKKSKLYIIEYNRFLYYANQLVVYKKI